jgi:uncharacterized protein
MQVENHFDIPLPPPTAWPILMDVAQTAACFPGASLIEAIDSDHYKGNVTVKLGPLTMVFAGHLSIEDRDDTALGATVKAQWRETKGRGNAVTTTRFSLQPHEEGSRIVLRSELQLAGQVAQYGRGVGMISAISAQLISTFAENLRTRIRSLDSGAPAPAVAGISGLSLVAKALGNRLKGG